VEVKSEEGSGSRFTIRLPLTQASAASQLTQLAARSTMATPPIASL
jgi:chemotaxis protein histidine kinase CheA